jgi:hypothetical protein
MTIWCDLSMTNKSTANFGMPRRIRINSMVAGWRNVDEQSVGRGAADLVAPEVNVDWRRPGERQRSISKTMKDTQ